MENIDVQKIIESKIDPFFKKFPGFFRKFTYFLISRILHVREINHYINHMGKVKGLAAIDEIFDYVKFSYTVSDEVKHQIPKTGKLICVSNHPLGGLDGLALMKCIGEERHNIKMLANELLMNVRSIEDMFIPVDVFSSRQQKSQLVRIRQAIENEDAIIIFPAGRVSRLTWHGIRDREWTKGAVYFAQKFDAPVLPIYVKGRNSILFYLLAFLWDRFGTFLLPHQLFRKGKKSIEIIIGDIIPPSVFSASVVNQKSMTKLLMKHVYLLGKGKRGILKTEKPVIHAVNSSLVKDELNNSTLLYESPDKKKYSW